MHFRTDWIINRFSNVYFSYETSVANIQRLTLTFIKKGCLKKGGGGAGGVGRGGNGLLHVGSPLTWQHAVDPSTAVAPLST